jgi:hypothetical protein
MIVERKTELLFPVEFYELPPKEIKVLQKQYRWNFKWIDSYKDGFIVYAMTIRNDGEIQGLISLQLNPDRQSVDIDIVESAPNNLGSKGRYDLVGEHLFTFACNVSFDNGFDGYVFFKAKTSLIEHYEKMYGAKLTFNQNMFINTESALVLKSITMGGE